MKDTTRPTVTILYGSGARSSEIGSNDRTKRRNQTATTKALNIWFNLLTENGAGDVSRFPDELSGVTATTL